MLFLSVKSLLVFLIIDSVFSEGYNKNGYILFYLVFQNGYREIVELLLKEGIDFYVVDYWNYFLLYRVFENGYIFVVEYLVL